MLTAVRRVTVLPLSLVAVLGPGPLAANAATDPPGSPAVRPANALAAGGTRGRLRLEGPAVAESSGARLDLRDWTPLFASDYTQGGGVEPCSPYDGAPAGQAAGVYRPDEVQVSGGMLRLGIRRRDYADRPYTSGGIGCKSTAGSYGRYEYRAKTAPGFGLESYVALWPEDGSLTNATLLQVSTARGQRSVLHVSNGYGGGITRRELPGEFSDGFHDYTVEWAPTGLRIWIDNHLLFTDPRVSSASRWLGFAVSTGDGSAGLPDPAQLPAEFLIDWLRVYHYDPAAAEEFADEPDGGSGAGGPVPSASVTAQARDQDGRGGGWPLAIGSVLGFGALLVAATYGAMVRIRRNGSSSNG